jgi:hypothetical protein
MAGGGVTHQRIHFTYPIAKPSWSKRLYPVAEFATLLGGVLLILGIGFFASWTGQ